MIIMHIILAIAISSLPCSVKFDPHGSGAGATPHLPRFFDPTAHEDPNLGPFPLQPWQIAH